PFMVSQATGHLHMSMAFLVPVLGMAAHEVLIAQRRSALSGGIVLGLVAVAQMLTGEELLAIVVIAVGVGILVLALLHRRAVRRRVRHAVRGLGVAAVTFLVIGGGPLAFQFLGPQTVHGSVQPPDLYVADLWSWVVPTVQQWLHT